MITERDVFNVISFVTGGLRLGKINMQIIEIYGLKTHFESKHEPLEYLCYFVQSCPFKLFIDTTCALVSEQTKKKSSS
jgi:hypothetical protein